MSIPQAAQTEQGSDFHLFATDDGPHLLLVDGSQLFKIDEDLQQRARGGARRAGTGGCASCAGRCTASASSASSAMNR